MLFASDNTASGNVSSLQISNYQTTQNHVRQPQMQISEDAVGYQTITQLQGLPQSEQEMIPVRDDLTDRSEVTPKQVQMMHANTI